MPPAAPSPRTRHQAQVIQWIAYALAGGLLGLAWLPFARWIGYPIENPVRDLLWVSSAGLAFAFAFRGVAFVKGREPSQWLAAAFPVIACTARTLANGVTGAPYEFAKGPGEDWFWSMVYAYTCVSVAVIPLAAAHLAALRWVHQRLIAWAAGANRRGVRHASFAIGCVAFMLVTEGPRLTSGDPVSAHDLAQRYGFSLPLDSKLISHSKGDDQGFESFWIRSAHRISWPLVDESKPLSDPLQKSYLVTRAIEEAGAKFRVDDVDVHQAKWSHRGRIVRANLVRIGHRDYLEIASW